MSSPYVSLSTASRRARVAIEAIDRTAGIDVNVSNVTVASHEQGRAFRVNRIVRDATQQQRDRSRSRRERRRQRALDRSRRAMNRAQYRLSNVVFAPPGQLHSAYVDYAAAAEALPAIRRALSFPYAGWRDTLSESTDLSAREGSFLTWRTSTPDPVAVARRIVGMAPCPTLNETGFGQTTPERARMRTDMASKHDPASCVLDTS